MAGKSKWNKNRQEKNQIRWTKQQERKKKRRETQEAAHKRNQELIKEGKLTPWQQAKADAWKRKLSSGSSKAR